MLWWAGSRLLVLATAAVVQIVGWPTRHWHPGLLAHPFALLAIWDARWYRIVAERGYFLLPGHESDAAFFPLLPSLLALLHRLGLPIVTTGLVLGNLGFLAGLLGLYELGRDWVGEGQARRAALYAAVFPFSFVFSMLYPEGIVLAATTFAVVLARRGRWTPAAVLAGLAALGRPEGLFVFLPLAALAARRWGGLSARARPQAVAAVLAAPAGLVAFSAYLWQTTGDPWAWTLSESAWGRTFSLPSLYQAPAQVLSGSSGWLWRDVAFFVAYAAFLVRARRAVPASWLLAGSLILLLPLTTGTFTSEARFGLLAVPVYFGMAELGRNPRVDRVLRWVSVLGLTEFVATLWQHWP